MSLVDTLPTVLHNEIAEFAGTSLQYVGLDLDALQGFSACARAIRLQFAKAHASRLSNKTLDAHYALNSEFHKQLCGSTWGHSNGTLVWGKRGKIMRDFLASHSLSPPWDDCGDHLRRLDNNHDWPACEMFFDNGDDIYLGHFYTAYREFYQSEMVPLFYGGEKGDVFDNRMRIAPTDYWTGTGTEWREYGNMKALRKKRGPMI